MASEGFAVCSLPDMCGFVRVEIGVPFRVRVVLAVFVVESGTENRTLRVSESLTGASVGEEEVCCEADVCSCGTALFILFPLTKLLFRSVPRGLCSEDGAPGAPEDTVSLLVCAVSTGEADVMRGGM